MRLSGKGPGGDGGVGRLFFSGRPAKVIEGVTMNSSLISKIEKARKYAEEKDERLRFESFSVVIRGDNGEHVVSLTEGVFACDCDFFVGWSSCSHVMAIERVLGGTIPEPPAPQHR